MISGRVPTDMYMRLPTSDLYGRRSSSSLSDGDIDDLSGRHNFRPGSIGVVTGCESF